MVDEEPVTKVALLGNEIKVVASSPAPTSLEQLEAQLGGHDDEEAVDEPRGGDGGEADEPEPDENVDLLVDDVHRQHAHGIVSLNGP